MLEKFWRQNQSTQEYVKINFTPSELILVKCGTKIYMFLNEIDFNSIIDSNLKQ